MTEIRKKYTGKIIIEDEDLSLKKLVEKAVKEGVNLSFAILSLITFSSLFPLNLLV